MQGKDIIIIMTPIDSIPMFDFNVIKFIQDNFHNPVSDAIFPFITHLGEAGAIWIAAAIIMVCFKKSRKCGILALCAMTVTFLFGEVFLKNVVCRVRPCNQFPEVAMLITRPRSFSFPSGHSASSFAAATIIFWFNKKFGLLAIATAALIAFSRVFLFVHYPTDILAGALLGILISMLTIVVYKKFFLNRKKLN